MKKTLLITLFSVLLPALAIAQENVSSTSEAVEQNRKSAYAAQQNYDALVSATTPELQQLDAQARQLRDQANNYDSVLRKAREKVKELSHIRSEQSRRISNLRKDGASREVIAYERTELEYITRDLDEARLDVRDINSRATEIKRELSSVRKKASSLRGEINKAKNTMNKEQRKLDKSLRALEKEQKKLQKEQQKLEKEQ